MHSTQQVVRLLRDANPNSQVSEEHIRRVLRRGDLIGPALVAGRLIWRDDEIVQLAAALQLVAPALDERGLDGGLVR